MKAPLVVNEWEGEVQLETKIQQSLAVNISKSDCMVSWLHHRVEEKFFFLF